MAQHTWWIMQAQVQANFEDYATPRHVQYAASNASARSVGYAVVLTHLLVVTHATSLCPTLIKEHSQLRTSTCSKAFYICLQNVIRAAPLLRRGKLHCCKLFIGTHHVNSLALTRKYADDILLGGARPQT